MDLLKHEDISDLKYRVTERFQLQTDIIPEEPIETLFSSLTKDGLLTLEKGFLWNGANVVPDTENLMLPSAIHDAFCNWHVLGLLTLDHRKQSDKLLKDLLLNEQVRDDGKISMYERVSSEVVFQSVKAFVYARYGLWS